MPGSVTPGPALRPFLNPSCSGCLFLLHGLCMLWFACGLHVVFMLWFLCCGLYIVVRMLCLHVFCVVVCMLWFVCCGLHVILQLPVLSACGERDLECGRHEVGPQHSHTDPPLFPQPVCLCCCPVALPRTDRAPRQEVDREGCGEPLTRVWANLFVFDGLPVCSDASELRFTLFVVSLPQDSCH